MSALLVIFAHIKDAHDLAQQDEILMANNSFDMNAFRRDNGLNQSDMNTFRNDIGLPQFTFDIDMEQNDNHAYEYSDSSLSNIKSSTKSSLCDSESSVASMSSVSNRSETTQSSATSSSVAYPVWDAKLLRDHLCTLDSSTTAFLQGIIPTCTASQFTKSPMDYCNILSVFATILGISMIDLDSIIVELIDVVAIRKDEWDGVRLSTNSVKKNRTIVELGSYCYHCTRFSDKECLTLKQLFFGAFLNDSFSYKENRFTYEETMLISLTYMAHGTPYIQLRMTYGHDWTRYGYMIEWFATFLFHKYYHRICGKSMEYWATEYDITQLREKIFNYICFDDNGNRIEGLEHVQKDMFRVFAWIDCMMHVTSRPGSGPINEENERHNNEDELQRAFYTSYGHQWGIKNQALLLPNGMLGSIYTTSLAQNDKGVVNISGIAEELERVLEPWKIPFGDGSVFPAVYGDDIYDVSSVIVKRVRGVQPLFHQRMTKSRIDIEHEFGLVSNLFKRVNTKHTWHIMSLKNAVDYHYCSIFLMVNIYTCMRENKTSAKYEVASPQVQDYLDVSRRDAYDGDDADQSMLDHLSTQNNW